MVDLLTNLNDAQKDAVLLTDQNLLILAGAGSGKTRVLTHKIAYLISEKGVHPGSILAMTFSNRAAREMKERIANLLSFDKVPFAVGTFHAMCMRILREFTDRTDLKENFTIYDEDDQRALIKEVLSELNLDDKKYKPRRIVETISREKNRTLNENSYFELEVDRINLQNIYEKYTELLIKNNALDFVDILLKALKLLEIDEIRQELSGRWKYILIDEYQDTNRVQRELIKRLGGESNIVCAVGDDDQSIYRWRGATVENILEFSKDFSNSELIKLERNYRSSKKILNTANALIQYNSKRLGKTLFSENGDGDNVGYYQASTDRDEAAYIVSKIDYLINRGLQNLRDIAVFYRTHAQSRVIEEALVEKGIPYRIVGGTRFYDRKEIRDILAYLKFFANKADGVSLKRIVNVPPRGIGKKTIQMLETTAAVKNTNPWTIIQKKIPIGGKTHEKFRSFLDFVEHIEDSKPSSVHELATMIVDLSGYQGMLLSDDSYENEVRMDNIRELLSSIKEYDNKHPDGTINNYLETISLVDAQDNYEATDDYATLMTVHCSKGLEFKTVFIAGLEEGLFPHQNSLEQTEELEEERRLFYVALTRAMEKLYLSGAFQRRFYSQPSYKMPSRFLDEIRDTIVRPDIEKISSSIKQPKQKKRPSKDIEPAYFEDYIPNYEDETQPYKTGMKVRHPEFGEGKVKQCTKSGDHWRLTIDFRHFGIKKIVPGYVDLEVV